LREKLIIVNQDKRKGGQVGVYIQEGAKVREKAGGIGFEGEEVRR
jgi:hypothetical protein